MGNTVLLALGSMAGLACFFALVLALADKKLRVEVDPKVDELIHLLPGINCGACGFLSCQDFAEHIVTDGADPGKCRVVHEEARKEIFDLLGEEETEPIKKVALVHCASEWKDKKNTSEYRGIKTCRAASLNFGSGMKCTYGCMGFGDCTLVCPFDAIHMVEGLPKVDPDKCTGCGKCALACPRGIIDLSEMKYENIIYVACNSNEDLMATKKACDVGCIACGVCVRLSQDKGYFTMENNLSRADYSKQFDQEAVKAVQAKCPTKVIKTL